jgi:hypothetical protein
LGHYRAISSPCRAAFLASALAATLALGGCGGIEFQGKVFDYMGLSGDRQEPDVKMSERPPLLLPPDTKALPQPGSGVAVATAREDWPKNPEIVQQEAVEAQKAAKAKEVTDATDAINPLQGKSNPLLDKWLSKKKKVVQPNDTPEPDPTDKPSEGETVAQSKPKPLTPHVPQELPPPTAQDPFHPAAPDSYKNPSAIY